MLRRIASTIACSVVVAALAACGGSSGGSSAAPSATASSAGATSTAPASTTTTTTAPAAPRHLTVSRRDIVVEDTSRPTAADPGRGLEEKPSRTLPLMILAPDGAGPFPLVVFSHGVTGTGPAYQPFLEPIAAAGYVIIAPTYPLSSGPDGTIPDYVNQPGDVFFALDSVLAMADDPTDPLHGKLDPDHIALAGHSLGAMTTVGAALNSCCAQARVDAAILLAGIQVDFPNGDFTHRTPVPLLLAHGTADTTLPVDGSDKLYEAATGPTAFLKFPGGSHSGILGGEDATVLQQTVVAWLDRWLRDEPDELASLPAAVEASGIANLTTKGF
jgi:dienelactone hydrolase